MRGYHKIGNTLQFEKKYISSFNLPEAGTLIVCINLHKLNMEVYSSVLASGTKQLCGGEIRERKKITKKSSRTQITSGPNK